MGEIRDITGVKHGIETAYEGVVFRSRLEAKWAAFFDLLGWPWEYEPFDLAGYIPDFVLKFRAPLLVEVKPLIVERADDLCYESDAIEAMNRIDRSGWGDEALLVGATIWIEDGPYYPYEVAIGLLREVETFPEIEEPYCWASACLIDCPDSRIGLRHASHSWICRSHDHPGRRSGANSIAPSGVELLFREAGNRVQWNPGGR